MSEWEWPQWFYIGLIGLNIIMGAALHGKPRTGDYNVLIHIISGAISASILYAGGFW